MKFDYTKEFSHTKIYSEYHFQFTLTQDEVNRVLHKYAVWSPKRDNIIETLEYGGKNDPHTIQWSLRLLQDAFTDDGKVDLGIDYKKKYEELVELLEPHKIDESMGPSTTLKMILKYNK